MSRRSIYLNGGQWRDLISETAKIDGSWSTVRVNYIGGIVVWANSSTKPVEAGGHTIPQYGWLAKVSGGVSAGTVDVGGRLVDFAETPSSVHVNARPAAWRAAASSVTPVSVDVDSRLSADRSAHVSRGISMAYRNAVAGRLQVLCPFHELDGRSRDPVSSRTHALRRRRRRSGNAAQTSSMDRGMSRSLPMLRMGIMHGRSVFTMTMADWRSRRSG